jgi:Transmembrane exosortase (Exosortase_EpsH)
LTASVVSSPATTPSTRRELFIWFVAILLATKFFQSVLQVSGLSVWDHLLIQAAGIGAFQLLAWFAVFRLLVREPSTLPATRQDFAVIGILGIVNIALGAINVMPAQREIWIVATLAAIYIFVTNAKGSYGRAAATVLLALCAQSLWGPVFFSLFALDLLRGDAVLVGTILDATRSGYTWHDNIVETQGHAIEIYGNCSSFHNVSLSVLCWVTLTKLNRPTWIPTDFIFGAAACVVMIAVNVARLYVAALSYASYEYWHNGFGAHIFQIGVSVMILLICLWGSSIRDSRSAK